MQGTTIGAIKGDTRSLDYSSCEIRFVGYVLMAVGHDFPQSVFYVNVDISPSNP